MGPMIYLWVGLGGAAGAMARVGLMQFFPASFLEVPLRILLVNIVGCFLIGAIAEAFAIYGNPSMSIRHFVITGFLGGFTTFSSFALDFGVLCEKGYYGSGIAYILLSVGLGVGFFYAGLAGVRVLR